MADTAFTDELEHLINKHSRENESDTPDFILANYMGDCLAAYARAVKARQVWWGHESPWADLS